MGYDIDRFIKAQERDYETALAEMRAGCKQSHWIWYIFPQLQGLGNSSMCKEYGVHGLGEAEAILANPYLSAHLIEISHALLEQPCRDANVVMGWSVDARKLRSSMTLFALVDGADPVFRQVIDDFFDGKPDRKTINMLGVDWN